MRFCPKRDIYRLFDSMHGRYSTLASVTLYRQLLHDCGIGLEVEEEEVTSAVGQHRALLFCQYKSMLDIIERDLFK